VVELLSLHIKQSPIIKGLSIFGKEIRVTQLADDTALFLSDKHQINNAITLIDQFSAASGLKLKSKCEILCLYQTDEEKMFNLPVKKCVKYLGIHICRDHKETARDFNN